MKKFLLITFTLLLCASWSFAADFTPTRMTLTVPDDPIIYPFDGSAVDFNFDLGGTSAAIWLVINTKLSDAEKPVALYNGNLNWHYVNKIDTTVYVSSRNAKDAGTGLKISWDGKSDAKNGGATVAPGQYNYYLWGYDDKSVRVLACDFISTGMRCGPQFTRFVELGEDDMPLEKPMLMGSAWKDNINSYEWYKYGTAFKWEIGSDPLDESKAVWSHCTDYHDVGANDLYAGAAVYHPNDWMTFYHTASSLNNHIDTAFKWTFVTDGNAIKDPEWLGWEEITWDQLGITSTSFAGGMWTDREYLYIPESARNPVKMTTQWDALRILTFDGEILVNEKQLEDLFYMPDDNNLNDWHNGEFDKMMFTRDGGHRTLMAGHAYCRMFYVDCTRLIADEGVDEQELILWENGNGDYINDRNWEEGSEQPWACVYWGYHDWRAAHHNTYLIDKNNFCITSISFYGTSSITLTTQDGTGVDYAGFADDTVSSDSQKKMGGTLCHNGSAYDGFYWNGAITEDPGASTSRQNKCYYIAFDSAKGVIANEISPAVEDEEVAKFSIDQNSPNPFNPTTTIGFNLVEDGNVTIDIYNVAGQKVDTLVNDFMAAGKHSVVWDAAGFSAGVYFYTVKSGDFTKTMKMTLLK